MSEAQRARRKKPPLVLRLSVQIRTLFKISVVLFVMLLVATYFGVHTTEKPKFCSSCKIMVPYYQAWKTSTHNNVPCIECHYAPGIVNTFEGKFKALSQVAKYVTSTAGTRPWAEIPDESCLREGCHERRLLQSKVKYKNIEFDHRPHLMDLRRGKQLRCTSCHSQVVMGNHLSVTPSTCFTCHFKNKSFAELWGSCLMCHTNPPRTLKVDGKKFQHGKFIDNNVPCMKCHIDVVDGKGNVPRERCYSCHSEEKHTAKYNDTPLIHKMHVTDHKVECFDCHLEIRHGNGTHKTRAEGPPACETCHLDTHRAQLDMYYGRSGRLAEPHESEMAARRVDCRACHIVNPNKANAKFQGATLITKSIACMNCHGPEYEDILDNWKRGMKLMLLDTEASARAASDARAAGWPLDGKTKKIAEKLYNDATFNLNFVREARGEHNIHYARELLDTARTIFDSLVDPDPKQLNDLSKVKKKAGLLSSDYTCTNLCHVVQPDREIKVFNRTFPHAAHGPRNGTSCTSCHSAQKHGKTEITAESCDKCHHVDNAITACGTCHNKRLPVNVGRFPHNKHVSNKSLSCNKCHWPAGTSGAMSHTRDCVTCHHGPRSAARCTSCHRGSISTRRGAAFPHTRHATSFGVSCTTCHSLSGKKGKMVFTRNCSTCHHSNPKARCYNCHRNQAGLSDKSKMDFDCQFCHRRAGEGFAQPLNVCSQCHKLQIEQETDRHGGLNCQLCHTRHSWRFKGGNICAACHQKYKHKEDVGNDCLSCHKPHGWDAR